MTETPERTANREGRRGDITVEQSLGRGNSRWDLVHQQQGESHWEQAAVCRESRIYVS